MKYDVLVAGAGFAGSVIAERLASQLGKRVLVTDIRNHVAGNCFDTLNEHGILYQPYGNHLFHTNAERIFEYLSNFTQWRPYEHEVVASIPKADKHVLVPIPINRNTINTLYDKGFTTDQQVAEFYEMIRDKNVDPHENSETAIVSQVGWELYELFFKGYTTKMWDKSPSELSASVCSRIPIRTNDDNRYFSDKFQFMPKTGYTKLFERMLKSDLIDVSLNTNWENVPRNCYKHLIYTGPIDDYFNYCAGRLPYRSLEQKHFTVDTEFHLPCGTINYPGMDGKLLRIAEFKWGTGQKCSKTACVAESPAPAGPGYEPYYPINSLECLKQYKIYEELTKEEKDVTFTGRLATYKYYNMDMVVAQSLKAFERLAKQ